VVAGKNKSQPNAVVDYTRGVYELGHHGHYIVINVSSPNTPGLRKLQGRDQLHALLSAVKQTRDALETQPPLLVKIAPDMTDQDLEDVVAVVKAVGFEGIIVSNTTVARPASLVSSNAQETGGLSGQPLFEPSTAVLRKVYRLTEGQIPLIGVGGVASGAAAYAKIRNGASLVQLYTAMSLQGPGVVPRIKGELAALLHQDGFDSVSQAVGVDA
jgi:dihydroorotate dehydrogenase